MPWIDHPARQYGPASVMDWLRYKLGMWMEDKGRDLQHQALYPADVRCPDCGAWVGPGQPCDHIPF
jgi:hypothetical protein